MPGAYAKNSEKTARPKPNVPRRQRKPCGEAPPKPAAVRGNPPKFAAVRGNPPKPAAVRGNPPKPAAERGNPPKPAAERGNPPKPAAVRGSPAKPRRRAANRAEYKKSGGSYDPPFAWFIFVSLLKTNISLALVI